MLLALIVFAALFKAKPENAGLAPFKEEDLEAAAQDAALDANLSSQGFFYPYQMLLRESKLPVFCLISAIAGIGRYGLLTWIPTYFTEAMGLSVQSGIFSSILLPVGQACAMYIFPVLTDKVFKGKREPMLILCAAVSVCTLAVFPFIRTQILASAVLFAAGVFSSVGGIIWAVAGDMGGRAFSSAAASILDWATYMGAALQATLFGFIKETWGWPAMFLLIAGLYMLMAILTLAAYNGRCLQHTG